MASLLKTDPSVLGEPGLSLPASVLWCPCEGDTLSLGAAASLTESMCVRPARDLLGGRWIPTKG